MSKEWISKTPTQRIALPSRKLCVQSMEWNMKEKSGGKFNLRFPWVCDVVSNISVTRVGDRGPLSESCTSKALPLKRKNEVIKHDVCHRSVDNGVCCKERVPERMEIGSSSKLLNKKEHTVRPAMHKKNIAYVPSSDQSDVQDLTAAIRSTVEVLLQKQVEVRAKSGHDNTLLKVENIKNGRLNGLSSTFDSTQMKQIRKSSEQRIEVLVSSDTRSFPEPFSNKISVTKALPSDDVAIANLRLSAFSDFNEDQRRQFCERSCEILNKRRQSGATCLVARNPTSLHDNGEIIGSVECSTHEFTDTELGKRRPGGTIMYITEVAVLPKYQRCGVGTMLLKGIDQFAKCEGIETAYLHVDVENVAACRLYKSAGYEILDSANKIYSEFTTKLNLQDGVTNGRRHFLLNKKLTESQTWVTPSLNQSILGFKIPH